MANQLRLRKCSTSLRCEQKIDIFQLSVLTCTEFDTFEGCQKYWHFLNFRYLLTFDWLITVIDRMANQLCLRKRSTLLKSQRKTDTFKMFVQIDTKFDIFDDHNCTSQLCRLLFSAGVAQTKTKVWTLDAQHSLKLQACLMETLQMQIINMSLRERWRLFVKSSSIKTLLHTEESNTCILLKWIWIMNDIMNIQHLCQSQTYLSLWSSSTIHTVSV